MENKRFLQWDFQSIVLIFLLVISGISMASYLEKGNTALLLTFIGTSLIAYSVAHDLYRKRKKG